jgi:hypothetical protein
MDPPELMSKPLRGTELRVQNERKSRKYFVFYFTETFFVLFLLAKPEQENGGLSVELLGGSVEQSGPIDLERRAG